MTRRLVLVNVSNYPNETYEIAMGRAGTPSNRISIAPGETADIQNAFTDGRLDLSIAESINPNAPDKYQTPTIEVTLP